jgi:hypothetical protein
MPNGNPLVGEVWETTDPTGRTIRGIVADVAPNVLTLVSFTGNRFRIAPSRMVSTWRYAQAPPNTALHCSRRGCTHPGILRFVRGQQPDWVCPRHLPVGVQASLTTESLGPTRPEVRPTPPGVIDAEFVEVTPIRCIRCRNPDPVEDHRIQLPPSCSLWVCHSCNEHFCILSGLEPALSIQPEQYLRNVVDDIRFGLTVENYNIQRISVPAPIFRVFTRFASAIESNHCVYAGLTIESVAEVPNNAALVIELGGGPQYRPPPRPTQPARVVPDEPRARTMRETFDQLYGRVAERVVPLVPIAEESQADAHELLDDMAPTPFISTGTRWVNRSTGDIVEVVRLGSTTDGNEPVVHFKRVSDTHEPNTVLLQRDFENMFRSYVQPGTSTPTGRVVDILKDEEWEHVESGEVVKIDVVDTKRNLVTVIAKERRKSVPMADFINAKWRKLVRKTAFARIMEDD